MNKQEWLKNKIYNLSSVVMNIDGYIQYVISKREVLDLIDQLDEPEITDPTISKKKSVEVPKFVGDWIEKHKDVDLLYIGFAFNNDMIEEENVYEWIEDNKEKLYRAWLDGYTIEPEPRYRVKVNNDLYYVRHDELDIVFIKDDALGFVERAKLFIDKEEAKATANIVSGEVEVIPEDEVIKLIEGWKG